MNSKICEFCSSQSNVSILDNNALACEICRQQIEETSPLQANHWRCLQESIWSENPNVKIIAWRVLTQLSSESWAQDLLYQLDLDDNLLKEAKAGLSRNVESTQATGPRDCNGTELKQGDSVTLIKDLEVKGAGFTAKRGTTVKNITLTEDPALIECKVNGTQIVLKTCFLKKL